jgi:LAS superfamily LD-carboxypeptidase LdcB
VHLGAKEKDIRAENEKPLSAVNEDSCLELFFMPEGGDRYLNFEVNPNGCMHYQVGRDRTDRLSLYREDEKRFFDIKTDRTKDGWEVFYRIPVGFIDEFYPGYRFGGLMKANVYKCGDKTKHKHYLSWNPVTCSNPDFHRPEDFGIMRFGTDVSEMKAYAPDYKVLVNKKVKIDPEFIKTVKLETINNTSGEEIQVETMALRAFCKLRDDLKKKKNITIGIDSAYRSVERQQELMKEFTEQYGAEYAKKTVAEPGTSEHHTGLAIELVPKVDGKWLIENEDMMKQKEVFKEIHKALPEYGFILRYPKGKEKTTGYDYEPWHLRYIGDIEAAKEISCKGITFEEYLEK